MFYYSNLVARLLYYSAIVTFVAGIIAGLVYGNVEIEYTFIEKSAFVWQIALTWWVAGAISAVFLLGFAQIVEYLSIIINKLNDFEKNN